MLGERRTIVTTYRGRKNGGTVVEAVGFSGPGCRAAMEQHASHREAVLESPEVKSEYLDDQVYKEKELE